MWIRTYSPAWMLVGFILVVYLGHFYLWGMIVVIQILMASELFNLLRRAHEDRRIPGFRLLNWYFFFTTMLFMYGRILNQQIMHAVTPEKLFNKLVIDIDENSKYNDFEMEYATSIGNAITLVNFYWCVLKAHAAMQKKKRKSERNLRETFLGLPMLAGNVSGIADEQKDRTGRNREPASAKIKNRTGPAVLPVSRFLPVLVVSLNIGTDP
ncbi:unnamed protein product [Lactuca saligna]|uniref:phosphatidate cytidylyltransferase n=1 Tax=Lactuca saligna TaxID=75948 RepID=A0AA35YZR3_LACSI|nr:unnamed protein product [Lactuca saligna]